MAQQLDLAARVERRIDGFARQMVATFIAEVPIYRRLPQEQLDGEILDISRANLRVFFRCLREQRPPTEEELGEPRASAADFDRRAAAAALNVLQLLGAAMTARWFREGAP